MYSYCRRWGTFCARHAILVVGIPLVVAAGLSACVPLVEVTTNPVELWCPPDSEVRHQKDYYDRNFECVCPPPASIASRVQTVYNQLKLKSRVREPRHTQLPTLPLSAQSAPPAPPPLPSRSSHGVTGALCALLSCHAARIVTRREPSAFRSGRVPVFVHHMSVAP